MRISDEAIYLARYVQGRGGLRRELTKSLRTGRSVRKPARRVDGRGQLSWIAPELLISQRPAQVEDRAVPGSREGDLIIGSNNGSAIGTLVERTTRFTMLLHLPNGQTAFAVRDAITVAIATLPAALRRSLTWDQGKEMSEHVQLRIDADLPIYFCDPHSPWQRGGRTPRTPTACSDQMAISAITAAELTAATHLAATPAEAAKRQARLQEIEAKLEPIQFDGTAVRSYGLVVAAVVREGRNPRSRFADLLIAATAHANGLDLYTRKADDFAGLDQLVHVIAI